MAERNFVRKKVKSLTLGEKLRHLREDRRMRVHDLARKINVKDLYIDALEKGHYDKLPTKVYAKGFVRSYARYFGVPEHVLLNLFEREYSVYHNINFKDEEETVSKMPKVPRFIFTPRIIMGFIGFIFLTGIGVYLYYGVDNFISSPWLVIHDPVNGSVINDDHVVLEGQTRNNSRVFVNGQQIFVDVDGFFSEEIGLAQGVNVIHVRSINKFDKESVQEVTINAQYDVAQPEEDENDVFSLYVRAGVEPVWVNISADDMDVFNDLIEVDDTREFSARESIVITTSDGINTLVSRDGNDFQPLSEDDGVVRDMEFTAEEISENSDTSLDEM